MAKHLVIVESPTKAKTIRKFLGSDYDVIASMGHIRDLPSSASEIPAAVKDKAWAKLGVDVEHDFKPLYVIPSKKNKIIRELKQKLKDAEDIYLATDEDREGESISEGLLEILKPKVPVKRMVFHEITKKAVEAALAHPRDIDERLVRAQETRRILDRLVGYKVSPVLWKKIAFGLSAGRVQSPSLKAIVDRERERMRFMRATYWSVEASVKKMQSSFEAKLIRTDGKRIAASKDFDEATGKLKKDDLHLIDETQANKIAEAVIGANWQVSSVTEKPFSRKAPAPFTTSTLQQEANRKLSLSSRDAMRTAQSLYEKGHITYMRTDSTTLSEEALEAIRKAVQFRFGNEYVPESARKHATKSKGAQEAHEAIRPSLTFSSPDEIGLSGTERDLYELIWMRTLASQMPDSKQLQMTAVLQVKNYEFQASGMKILFPGFLRAYIEGADDVEQALEEKENLLPDLKANDALECDQAKPLSHETKPPARFTEASLVQYMEKVGIGRPSTYASTISTLLDRKYTHKAGNALIPTFTGMAVTQLLERHFGDLVDAQFTSNMEEALDRIASGEEEWLPYLKDFYLGKKGLQARVDEKTERIEPEKAKTVELPNLEDYRVKVGKFGPYVEAKLPRTGAIVKTNVPIDMSPSDANKETFDELLQKAQQGPTSLGQDPETKQFIYLRTGAYGPYVQLGEEEEGAKKKPKRASIPKDVPMESVDLGMAVKLLSLPRLLGMHPETGKEIRASNGRFGPYIVHDGDFRSLKKEDDVLTVTLERALELLAQPKRGRGGSTGKDLGKHPDDGKPVTLHEGKYGPYVKHGKINATTPKELKPEDMTLEKAVELIANKAPKTKTTKKKA